LQNNEEQEVTKTFQMRPEVKVVEARKEWDYYTNEFNYTATTLNGDITIDEWLFNYLYEEVNE